MTLLHVVMLQHGNQHSFFYSISQKAKIHLFFADNSTTWLSPFCMQNSARLKENLSSDNCTILPYAVNGLLQFTAIVQDRRLSRTAEILVVMRRLIKGHMLIQLLLLKKAHYNNSLNFISTHCSV